MSLSVSISLNLDLAKTFLSFHVKNLADDLTSSIDQFETFGFSDILHLLPYIML